MQSVDSVLMQFKSFLEASFPYVDEVYSGNYHEEVLRDAWLQSNWELLVEHILCPGDEYLSIYGNGADLYGKSSRVSHPNSAPTHKITVHPKSQQSLKDLLCGNPVNLNNLDFEGFCHYDGKYYYTFRGPLDNILLRDKRDELAVVDLDNVTFKKTPLSIPSTP